MRKKTLLQIISLLFLCFTSSLFAQTKGLDIFNTESIISDEAISKSSTDKFINSDKNISGNIINPDYYYIGPGDVIALQNLTISSSPDLLAVTPECSILIPKIGEVSVKGLTLSEARKLISDTVIAFNKHAKPYVTLFQARSVLVTIEGNVDYPGTISLPASYKVSSALKAIALSKNAEKIGQQQQLDIYNSLLKKTENDKLANGSGLAVPIDYKSRNISVYHADGTFSNVDLEKATITNDQTFDPCIREGDIISVPFSDNSYPEISISGAVNRPVALPFKKGDMLSFLLKSSYGLKDGADITNIKLIDESSNETIIHVDDNFNLTDTDIELKPGSAVIVPFKPELISNKKVSTISIKGMVARPGIYKINQDKDRLKDIIAMAGGFTKEAYLPLCKIIRKNPLFNFDAYESEFIKKFKQSDLTMEDTARLKMHLNYLKSTVACDFYNAFANNAAEDNVRLEDGDIIIVPEKPTQVYVFGMVKNPGYVKFEDAKELAWYIKKAGGTSPGAKIGRARIIRARNDAWEEGDKDVFVYAGDMVYVPSTPDLPPGLEMQNYALIFSAISSIISVGYFIIALINK